MVGEPVGVVPDVPEGRGLISIGSLFSGIGGLELGLEMVFPDVRIAWQAEADPFCLRVLSKRFPGVRRYIDVRLIDEGTERVDLVCGGFPCQDVSVAGSGAGLDGARSGLWSEYARIVRALRPRCVFIENVAALANRGLDRVLWDLAESGFDAVWQVFRASDVGAPHRRARLFLLAYADREFLRQLEQRMSGGRTPGVRDEGEAVAGIDGADVADAEGQRGREGITESSGRPRHRRADGDSDPRALADADGGRLEVVGDTQPEWDRASGRLAERHGLAWRGFPPGPADVHGWDGPQPAIRRGADGDAGRLDRLHALGNAVVPAVAAHAFVTLAARAGEEVAA